LLTPALALPNTQVEIVTIPTKYDGTLALDAQMMGLNGTYFHRAGRIDYQYTVKKEAWHNVVFIVCPFSDYDAADVQLTLGNAATEDAHSTVVIAGTQDDRVSNVLLPLLGGPQPHQRPAAGALVRRIHTSSRQQSQEQHSKTIAGAGTNQRVPVEAHGRSRTQLLDAKKETRTYLHGTIEFHNPYGYIPAELFGILPFQVCWWLQWIRALSICRMLHLIACLFAVEKDQ
jgi:hypothetical protein